MITPSGRVDKALGIQLQKVYKSISNVAVEKTSRQDEINISQFSALVEKTRAAAMNLPEIRTDKVMDAKRSIQNGSLPKGNDIASAMINMTVEGQVQI